MNEKLLSFQNKLTSLITEAKQIVEGDSPKDFDSKYAYRKVEKLLDQMEDALYELEYISKPAIEGKLNEMDNEKFELIDEDCKSVTYFSCGSRIEIYDSEENEWHIGRVEHKRENGTQGYYFYCPSMGHPFLYTGMRARIRRERYA